MQGLSLKELVLYFLFVSKINVKYSFIEVGLVDLYKHHKSKKSHFTKTHIYFGSTERDFTILTLSGICVYIVNMQYLLFK